MNNENVDLVTKKTLESYLTNLYNIIKTNNKEFTFNWNGTVTVSEEE